MTAEPVLLAAILLVLVVLLSAGFASQPVTAIPLLLLVQTATAASVESRVTLGQLNVYAADILVLALAAATLLRWKKRGVGLRSNRQLVVLLAILLLSVARGTAAFSLQPSVNAAREMLAMLTAAIFFSTVRVTPRLVRAVRNWLLLASALLVLSAVTFWFEHGFGTYATTGDRALDGLPALIVLQTTIILVVFPLFRGLGLRWAIPLAGVVVVALSTQRTVWAAGLVATAVLVIARPRSRGSTSVATTRLWVFTAVLAVVLLVMAGPPGATHDLRAGFEQSRAQNSTFTWRLEGWSILVNRQLGGPPTDLIVGSPSGTGEDRVIDGTTVIGPSHSMYVSTLTMTGVIGLALLLWLYIAALKRSRRQLRAPSAFVGQAALLFTAVLALQLTYFIGYSGGSLFGLMLGLACSFAHGSSHDRSVARQQGIVPATEQRP